MDLVTLSDITTLLGDSNDDDYDSEYEINFNIDEFYTEVLQNMHKNVAFDSKYYDLSKVHVDGLSDTYDVSTELQKHVMFLLNNNSPRLVFTNARKISNIIGIQGYVFLVDLESPNGTSIKDFAVLKSPQLMTQQTVVKYEAIISLLGINSLRKHVPNFGFAYAAFNCSQSVFIEDEPRAWCNSKGSAPYIVYEYIGSSQSLRDYLKESTSGVDTNSMASIVLQIIFSLKYAYESIKFTHFDLHPKNILLQQIDHVTSIKYPLSDGVRVDTDKIVKIIDYGFSYINIENAGIGTPNSPYIIGDYHRIFTTMTYYKTYNPDVNNMLHDIAAFFPKDTTKIYDLSYKKFIAHALSIVSKYDTIHRYTDSTIQQKRMTDATLLVSNKFYYDKIQKYMNDILRVIDSMNNKRTLDIVTNLKIIDTYVTMYNMIKFLKSKNIINKNNNIKVNGSYKPVFRKDDMRTIVKYIKRAKDPLYDALRTTSNVVEEVQ